MRRSPKEAGMEDTLTGNVVTAALEDGVDKEGKPCVVIGKITARRGDTIRWETGDREVSIWFPESGVFFSPILAIRHRGTIEATIPSELAVEERIECEYCIYLHETHEFVVGGSHPKVEIPWP